MKTLFLTISLLFLVSCTKEVDLSDLVFNDGDCLMYLKGSTTPFTGKVFSRTTRIGFEWYSEIYWEEGKPSGEGRVYRNGNLSSTSNYKEGVYHGEVIWFERYGWDTSVYENSVSKEEDFEIRSFWIKGDVIGDLELRYPDGTMEMKKPEEVTNFPVNLKFHSEC